ncbi:MAG: 50S ribosomal protein L23 [Chromatiaceae bacterium]|jgi:large subunit ribosomal protein L23|nr:50S ribosomal protein L23 [Gammaproteobacteria bacterium]MCP5317562.1 50S ribosomal protein L23 [Chromatiaceae bacterium]MCP5431241.1 50S ribosomal protein L23 [Chromatiaceae bacterium]HPQ24925.1 50S ribosomal protein L23 [Gammaproteobacteria bacterium]
MNKERLMKILLSPVVSEKSAVAADKSNQFAFKVSTDATKPEIAQAVELLFEVKVEQVRTVNVKGKQKRFGAMLGRRNNWKKAYVRLQAGHDIDFAGGA